MGNMLKSLIILIFLCPSVWSAAEVAEAVPVFNRTLVAVPGTGIEVEKGFLDFFDASRDDIHEYQRVTETGQKDNLPEVKAVGWFLDEAYREAFAECGKVRTAFLDKRSNESPLPKSGTPEMEMWGYEYRIFNFINNLTKTLTCDRCLTYPIDFGNQEVVEYFLSLLTSDSSNALRVMEGTMGKLFT